MTSPGQKQTTVCAAPAVETSAHYWPHIDTPQFKAIDLELREALATGATRVLVCESGSGKTYAAERFRRDYPGRVFLVTCHRYDTVNDLIGKLSEATRHRAEGRSISRRLSSLNAWLYDQGQLPGGKPMLILDEAENLTPSTFQALKAMYDTLKWSCATVLIGTDQLIHTMERLKTRNKQGMPQFYRRFKAGIRHIVPMDRSFALFLDARPLPPSFKSTIRSLCENYGELHDFLVPAMREADEMGIPFTERFFRLKYRLQVNNP